MGADRDRRRGGSALVDGGRLQAGSLRRRQSLPTGIGQLRPGLEGLKVEGKNVARLIPLEKSGWEGGSLVMYVTATGQAPAWPPGLKRRKRNSHS